MGGGKTDFQIVRQFMSEEKSAKNVEKDVTECNTCVCFYISTGS